MDPNTTIRPWLLACGNQYGINEAFYLRWPDESCRPETMFFTYRFEGMSSGEPAKYNLSTGSGYSANYKSVGPWLTRIRVDLYNSQDGLYELASLVEAIKGIPPITALFKAQNIGGHILDELEDDTDYDADEIEYHQHLVVSFHENVEFALTFDNEVAEEILFTLNIIGGEST